MVLARTKRGMTASMAVEGVMADLRM